MMTFRLLKMAPSLLMTASVIFATAITMLTACPSTQAALFIFFTLLHFYHSDGSQALQAPCFHLIYIK